jgi:ubiquinone/menaquinone biosynthesis C-methylase UbiE
MLKYQNKENLLEIRSGAGKWSEKLQKIFRELILADISKKCIEVCKKRFNHCNNITYFFTGGSDLTFLPNV